MGEIYKDISKSKTVKQIEDEKLYNKTPAQIRKERKEFYDKPVRDLSVKERITNLLRGESPFKRHKPGYGEADWHPDDYDVARENMLRERRSKGLTDDPSPDNEYKKGGKVKTKVKPRVNKTKASSRGDGCAIRGKTKGRMV